MVSRGYSELVKELVDRTQRKEVGYLTKIYVEHYSENLEHLYEEMQVMVKYFLCLETMKKLRLDQHLASTYVIARRALRSLENSYIIAYLAGMLIKLLRIFRVSNTYVFRAIPN